MDGVGGTLINAFLAEFALLEVDVGEVVGYGDGLVGTSLGTLAATDTCYLTFLHGHCAFLLVGASHVDTHAARALVAELYDGAGTSLHAGCTAHTLVLDDFGQAGLEIHFHCAVGAGLHAVAASETAVGAG